MLYTPNQIYRKFGLSGDRLTPRNMDNWFTALLYRTANVDSSSKR